ncbi:MAG: T9SS C-terminal target domain-containing protein, partial [Balneolaceae bacterium]
MRISVTQEAGRAPKNSPKTPSRLRHLLPLLLSLFLFGSAEQLEVTGRVLSTYGLAVEGHPVSLFDDAGQSLASGVTGSDGKFTLVYERQATSADPERRGGTEQPDDFRLGQAYPNPFNPRTVVPFYAADDGRAAITVYNLLGQRVLQTEAGLTRGAHEIEIRLGDNLAQGPYLLNVRGDGFSETRSMTYVSAGIGGGDPGIRIRTGTAVAQSAVDVASERSARPGRDISLDFSASSGHIHPNTQTETPGTFLLVIEEESGFERTEIDVPADQDHAAGIINLEFALTDEELLDKVQEGTFQYFWDGAHA